jgi:hypothetical protein
MKSVTVFESQQTIIKEVTPAYTDTVTYPTADVLPAPYQITPENKASVDISAADVELSWSMVDNATSYRLMVAENYNDLTQC